MILKSVRKKSIPLNICAETEDKSVMVQPPYMGLQYKDKPVHVL